MQGKLMGISNARPSENGKSYQTVHIAVPFNADGGLGYFQKSYSITSDFKVAASIGDDVIFYERFFGMSKTNQPMVGLDLLQKVDPVK